MRTCERCAVMPSHAMMVSREYSQGDTFSGKQNIFNVIGKLSNGCNIDSVSLTLLSHD